MKKALLLTVLLIVVIAVSARLPRKPGKHGATKPKGCQLQNCNKCRFKPFSCDECDHGFVREKVPLGYACRETCSPGFYNVQGTCVEKKACTTNCKLCQGRSCFACEHGHALYRQRGKGVCLKKCPSGYRPKTNPAGGNECVRDCTANCKTCQGSFCSVCEQGHSLYKGFRGFGEGLCLRKCPKGYKTAVNPSGGNKCVEYCTANCKTCQGSFCSVCEQGHSLYKGFLGFGEGHCLRECPKGYKTAVNPSGGNKCVKHCTANCKTCHFSFCSVCEQGHSLYKGFGGFGEGRCLRKCPKGYKTAVNPSGGNKCVRSCAVANCKSCPRSWTNQPKCAKCESGFYRLSIGKLWNQHDFCFSHCPAGYVPKKVKGVAQCQKEPETEHTATTEPTTTEKSTTGFICNTRPYATTEADWTPSQEPTSEPGGSATSQSSATPEPITEPEPSPIFTDFWP